MPGRRRTWMAAWDRAVVRCIERNEGRKGSMQIAAEVFVSRLPKYTGTM
jgi:hypothetical protein